MKLKHLFILVLITGIALLFQSDKAMTIDRSQYWMKIRATNKFERSVIANLGVSIETSRDGYVYALGSIEDLKAVEKLGWLEVSFPFVEAMDYPKEDQAYHNYLEMTQALQNIVAQNSDIAKMDSIGKSVENRDIWHIQISGQLSKANELPGIVFMGGHHAREHLSVELPIAYIKYLITEYKNQNAQIVALLNSRDVHFIPVVNPDGMEFDISTGRYKMWRKNRALNSNGTYGVDLNRNYGFGWGTGGSSKNPNSETFMGTQPFSEPETQAIKNFVEAHANITILLSFHTFSELILYPWGHKYDGIENANDLAVHETMARKMAEWNGYTPQQSSDLYIASGDTTDWSYGEHKIISFTFELDPKNNGYGGGGFYPGDEVIPTVIQKNLNPVLYLIGYADNPYRVLKGRDF